MMGMKHISRGATAAWISFVLYRRLGDTQTEGDRSKQLLRPAEAI